MIRPDAFKPLLSVGISYINSSYVSLPPEMLFGLQNVMSLFINGQMTKPDAVDFYLSCVGDASPIEKVSQILSMTPNPNREADDDKYSGKKKTRPWSTLEDMRLISGIHKYGLESWGSIAAFVGNSRTKAQCAQRWTRGLDPRIAKIHWTPHEDEMLMRSIGLYGTKSWTKIAMNVPTRSDVQCRYRYKQLMAYNQYKPKTTKEAPGAIIQLVSQYAVPINPAENSGRIILPSIFCL